MGSMKINFGDVESSFEPLPEDTYDCVIETVEVRESKSSDNDYLNWELKVLDDEYEGRRLWMITSLGERALWKLKDTLLALEVIEEDDELDIQWDEDVDVTPQEGPRVTFPEVEGMACVAVVTNQVYEGRERNRVDEIRAGGEAPQKTAGPKATKKSAAKSGGSAGRRKLR